MNNGKFSRYPRLESQSRQPRAANITYFAVFEHEIQGFKKRSRMHKAAAEQIPRPYSRAEESARELNGPSE